MARDATLKFTPAEMDRIGKVRESLCTSFVDFIHHATMSACDYYESMGEAVRDRARQQATMDWDDGP